MVTQIVSPLQVVIDAVERKGQEITVRGIYHETNCSGPNHKNGDKHPSLHFWETVDDDGMTTVAFNCFSGKCSRYDILRGFGINTKLIPGASSFQPSKPALTLFDLAQYTQIDWQILFNLGLKDGVETYHRPDGSKYYERGVIIPYYLEDGTEYERRKIRIRLEKTDDKKHPRFKWNEGDEQTIVYGLQHLQKARDEQYIVIEEGESDYWTLFAYGIPALGIPGANNVRKVLDASILKDIPLVYVIQEKTDQAGINFPYDVQKQLRETGYTGKVLRVPLRTLTGAKDPNELHKQIVKAEKPLTAFKEQFQRILDQARPMDVDTGLQSAQNSPEVDTAPIEQAIANVDLNALFSTIPQLAQITRAQYIQYKQQIKASFGKQVNLNDLDAAVNEERKLSGPVEERLDLDHVAQAFYERHGDRWAFDVKRDTWRQWVGTHWAEPQTVKSGVYDIDELVVNLLHEFGVDVKSNGTLDCVHRLARGKCKRDFNPTSDLVNFKNGTLHVTTMEMIPHCKDDDLTYCLGYDYTPGEHPNTSAFLQQMLCIIQEDGTHVPDYHAVQAYMAHLGLALIGDTSLHNFCILYGARRAGKSTLLRLGNAVCGHATSNYADYAGDTLFSSELEGKRVRYVRNSQRLVCVDEVSPDALRAEGILKNMTAHSGVEMRGMQKDEGNDNQWRPKLLLSTNDFPHYKDTAGAIKERVIYLHAPYERPKEARNPKLFEEMLLPELGSFTHSCIVLAKAVLARWYYPLSGNMKRLSNAAETNGSALKAFLEEYCVIASGAKCPTGVLYEKLKAFREENGHSKNYSKLSMVSDLKDMNVGIVPGGKAERYEGKPQKLLHGIRLREEGEEITEGPGLIDDPLLLPIQRNDKRNDCNGYVTINSDNRYISQNGSASVVIPFKNGQCNDVTIKSDKSSLREPHLDTVKGVGGSRDEIEGQNIVTSLHGRANKPLAQDETRNDSEKASLQTVTPIVTSGADLTLQTFRQFKQSLYTKAQQDPKGKFLWHAPGTSLSTGYMTYSVIIARCEACLANPQEREAVLRYMREHLEKGALA